ncbi:hypothetical protein [Pseudoroseomonas ludipueritiae]|uniref:hypothetical protein n=1 Tax=Pseudoroseomonas ludipueritiae TaxID=198093 RepID=UPI0018888D24|nr:hypothetical protein [Pseudoroseomonas ludipueritiae]
MSRKKLRYKSYHTQTALGVVVQQSAIRAFIRQHVTRDQLADDLQMLRAARRKGGRLSEDGGFQGKGALRVAGYAAHEAYEQLFRSYVPGHGGAIADHVLPGTNITVHQAVAVYGPVYVARATINCRRDLPTPNATRKNAAQLNAAFDPQGKLDIGLPPEKRCFVLLLTRRDPQDIGAYEAIDIAVLMSDFSGFSLYEDADTFLAGYGEVNAESVPDQQAAPNMGIKLRGKVQPFTGGEHGEGQGDEGDTQKGSG